MIIGQEVSLSEGTGVLERFYWNLLTDWEEAMGKSDPIKVDRRRGNNFHVLPSDDVWGKPPKVYGDGRQCAHPGCDTVLSCYNPGPYCYKHRKDHALSSNHAKGRMALVIISQKMRE